MGSGCVEFSHLWGPAPGSSHVFVVGEPAQTDDDAPDETAPDETDPSLAAIYGGVGEIPPLPDVELVTTDSGLTYADIVVGSGVQPEPSSEVTVNYTGWLTDGTEFDSGDNVKFNLNGVIAGWTEGVGSMHMGGTRRLLIPPDLAYGANGSPPSIPGDATLVFDVDLLPITDE
ncbi:MAG: FKBP-type peptidyl-prolyl cis-trans isomerase [bacterium]|nr:FKBP-type peptidyl-prolyl cis-trans isomerase [bacterium]